MNAPDRAWLEARKSGIGGSDVAAILGLSPWRSAVDVFLDKTSPVVDLETSEPMYWGIVLEEVVAKEYSSRTGRKVQRLTKMLSHPEHPWMLANLDRVIVTPGSRARWEDGKLLGADGLLECKTASAYKAAEWSANDEDAVPTYYAAQCFWYLAVTGAQWIDVACLIGGQRYVQKRIERDEAVIASLIERCGAFWHNHVLTGIAPEPTSGEDAASLFPQDNGELVEANPKTLELIYRARELKAQIAALELELDGDKKAGVMGVTGELKRFIGEASGIAIAGQTLATWKKAQDGQKTNWKTAADEIKGWLIEQDIAGGVDAVRDIIDQNTTTTPGARRLIIKE
jgi:putative phage-type endonuclease